MNLKSQFYKVLDMPLRTTGVRRRISGHQFRLPVRYCRYYESNYEPMTFAFLEGRCRPGDTVVDIGSHIGIFSVFMAQLVGRNGKVVSFEPNPRVRSVLERVIQLNRVTTIIEVRCEAVSDRTGTASFYDTGDMVSNASSLVSTMRSRSHFEVPITSVDDVMARRDANVTVLKIDCEGAELSVLKGAECTLQRCRPAVFLSVHPCSVQQFGGTLKAIYETLHRLEMIILLHGERVKADWFCSQRELFDVELVPVERLADFLSCH